MSEQRNSTFTILVRLNNKKNSERVEFFQAEQWKEKFQRNLDGLFRIRLNGSWFCPNIGANEGYFFCDFETAMKHLGTQILGIPLKLPGDQLPDEVLYTKKTRVRVKLKDGTIMGTYTMSKPFQDHAGAWRITLVGGSLCQHNPAYVNELEIVR